MASETRTVFVVDRRVNAFLHVDSGDTLEIRSSGTINFGSRFLGILPPILTADGDAYQTPDGYPVVSLRKNSLIVQIVLPDGRTAAFQGGTDVRIPVPTGISGDVFLLPNDGDPTDNTGGWTVEISRIFPDLAGPPMLRIDWIEVVQTLQRKDNTVPLIARKPVTVRVFPTSGTSASLSNVTGSLTVSNAAAQTFSLGPWSSGGSTVEVTAPPAGGHDRDRPDSSLNFVLPGLPPAGPLHIQAKVFVRGHERDPGMFADADMTAVLMEGRTLTIKPYLISLGWHGLGPPTELRALGTLRRAISRLPFASPYSPVPGVQILPPRVVPWNSEITDSSGLGMRAMMYYISAMENNDIGDLATFHVGFFQQPPNNTFGGMGTYRPFVRVPTCVTAISNDSRYDAETCAHELGHCFGLNHVDVCGAGVPWSSQLPNTTEEPGWDPASQTVIPARRSEMMSYCDPRWPSLVTYNWIMTHT